MDRYTETSSQGWFSRLSESIKGVLFGLLLFAVSFPILWWNEGRSVQTYKSLQEGRGAVVAVSADAVAGSNEGRLVHLSGQATTDETLSDPTFAITARALRLEREVEMYQWVEHEKTETQKRAGGKEEKVTTYTYEKEWNESLQKSSDFKHGDDHRNPESMPFRNEQWTASTVTVGAFTLSENLVGNISEWSLLAVGPDTLASVSEPLQSELKLAGEGLYRGGDPSSPSIGDVRIRFREVLPTVVSVIARQDNGRLSGFQTSAGDVLEMLKIGTVSADQMFKSAEEANKMLTWILRLVGFVLMAMGVGLVLRPLVVVADVIPMIGDLIGMGTGLVSVVVAIPLSLFTIGAAWIFYRPLLGGGLIGVGIAVVVGAKVMASGRRPTSSPPPPPPR